VSGSIRKLGKGIASHADTQRVCLSGHAVKRLVDPIVVTRPSPESINSPRIAFRTVRAERIEPERGCPSVFRCERPINVSRCVESAEGSRFPSVEVAEPGSLGSRKSRLVGLSRFARAVAREDVK
jgi:hypothetical protein